MPCDPEVLKQVSLFSRLDADEASILAAQVELKLFSPRQRIYKRGDPGERGYVLVSGRVRVTTVDEDHQEVVVDEPAPGEFSGSLPCWNRAFTRPRRSLSNRPSALK